MLPASLLIGLQVSKDAKDLMCTFLKGVILPSFDFNRRASKIFWMIGYG